MLPVKTDFGVFGGSWTIDIIEPRPSVTRVNRGLQRVEQTVAEGLTGVAEG